jgi:hypothetical protein
VNLILNVKAKQYKNQIKVFIDGKRIAYKVKAGVCVAGKELEKGKHSIRIEREFSCDSKFWWLFAIIMGLITMIEANAPDYEKGKVLTNAIFEGELQIDGDKTLNLSLTDNRANAYAYTDSQLIATRNIIADDLIMTKRRNASRRIFIFSMFFALACVVLYFYFTGK